MDFENLTVRLHVLIIFFMHVKFQEDKRSITISSTNVKISNFYYLKLYIKNKFIDRMVNNIQFERNSIYVIRTKKTYNPTIRFSKFTFNKEI